MTEEEAKRWATERFGEARIAQLEMLTSFVIEESANQNLVSASTLPHIWTRHIVDSAQLFERAAGHAGDWLDIGTGAGFPGLVVAILGRNVTMVEPRRMRVAFLERCIAALGIGDHARVVLGKVETLPQHPFAVISARAVAALPNLLGAAAKCSSSGTLWLLPKGRSGEAEVAEARRTWHGTFHVEHSITDPASLIVVATGVRRR